MDERLVRTRDVFLCQIVAAVTFVVAQRMGYLAHEMLLGLAIIAAAGATSAYLGNRLLNRRNGAINAYSVALAVGAVIYWLKWWVLD